VLTKNETSAELQYQHHLFFHHRLSDLFMRNWAEQLCCKQLNCVQKGSAVLCALKHEMKQFDQKSNHLPLVESLVNRVKKQQRSATA